MFNIYIHHNPNHSWLTLLLFLSFFPLLIWSHSRWKCPEPRSPATGIKQGPCGFETNDFTVSSSNTPITTIQPGPLRVQFEESIVHRGSPFRISLSGDGDDTTSCVLLDHIPHNNEFSVNFPRPTYTQANTYRQYVITIEIPNISCERCSLHLANPMTDKIRNAGAPNGAGCTDPNGSCFSVYHSCTKPFRIVGSGTNSIPRGQYNCSESPPLPHDWPTQWIGDNNEIVQATTPGVYRREASIWDPQQFTLTTVPLRYQLDAGGVCGQNISNSATAFTITAEDEGNNNIDDNNNNSIIDQDLDNDNADDVITSFGVLTDDSIVNNNENQSSISSNSNSVDSGENGDTTSGVVQDNENTSDESPTMVPANESYNTMGDYGIESTNDDENNNNSGSSSSRSSKSNNNNIKQIDDDFEGDRLVGATKIYENYDNYTSSTTSASNKMTTPSSSNSKCFCHRGGCNYAFSILTITTGALTIISTILF